VITQDNFDAYIPRTFSRRTWLVNTVDGQPTLGVFVMDNKPMYWLKQVKYVESIYLDKEPTEQIPLPNMSLSNLARENFPSPVFLFLYWLPCRKTALVGAEQ